MTPPALVMKLGMMRVFFSWRIRSASGVNDVRALRYELGLQAVNVIFPNDVRSSRRNPYLTFNVDERRRE